MVETVLNVRDTERAIPMIKHEFERSLCAHMNLSRVSAPLFVPADSGLNDDLSGVERPVAFDLKSTGVEVQVVQSLAKWKRVALKRYGYAVGEGLYTDMNAIRRDEVPDALHSLYVDQWDWEKVILPEQRTVETLQDAVRRIYQAILDTQDMVQEAFPRLLGGKFPAHIEFITSQELEDRYPHLTPKQREDAFLREVGAAFIMQIGAPLASGKPHDGRAPDYDDWTLNGDLMLYYRELDMAIELSSMGIRVDEAAMLRQLEAAGCPERAERPFHKMLLSGELPQTMGGGIGQSRLCMMLLRKHHIGEVQASVWPEEELRRCEEKGIKLL